MKLDIILAGVGGQGILSIATILGDAALRNGLFLKQAEVHGMSQRGGDVQSDLRISDSPIHSDLIPLGGADLIVSLEPMEALRYIPYLSPEGKIVTNTRPFVNTTSYPEETVLKAEREKFCQVIAFDMDGLAAEISAPRAANIILLGAASVFIPIAKEEILKGIDAIFSCKGEKIIEANYRAFNAGRAEAQAILETSNVTL